jgi:2-polyprenyl-6-hydroxyphenyl methylase / 3-demethylubiquinone-9 3-methyltransferase
MTRESKRYPEDHWIRSTDAESALHAYLEQQSKAYSRVKNDFVKELLGDLQGKRFLDYGCGGGWFTVYAAQAGAGLVLGVDGEEAVISTARHFARKESVDGICHFVAGKSFPSLPGGLRFDVILMKDVIEHVDRDQELLERAASALVPGGTLVLSTQNSLSLNYLFQGTYHRMLLGDETWYGWDPTHVRFYTPMSLRRKLRNAGLVCKEWRSAYIIPYKIPAPAGSKKQFYRIDLLSRVDRTLGRVFPYNRLGWNVIVKAQTSPLIPEEDPSRIGRKSRVEVAGSIAPLPLVTSEMTDRVCRDRLET